MLWPIAPLRRPVPKLCGAVAVGACAISKDCRFVALQTVAVTGRRGKVARVGVEISFLRAVVSLLGDAITQHRGLITHDGRIVALPALRVCRLDRPLISSHIRGHGPHARTHT